MNEAALHLPGSPAFRDLGGMVTTDGRRLAPRRLFRADALHSPAIDRDRLLPELALRLVCDLRSAEERELARCLHWLDPAPRSLHVELSADLAVPAAPFVRRMIAAPDPDAAQALMRLTYASMPRAAVSRLHVLFDALAAGEWPAVIHCTAGKDRTGFTVAMLLAALGVHRDAIYADYLLGSRRDPLQVDSPSSQYLTRLLGRELVPDEARFMHGVRREYLDASMEAIERDWGSIPLYLQQGLGLDDARLSRLREQFLE